MELTKLSIIESFHKYFLVELATTPAQVRKAQRIRYRVYCEELGYEPAENFPDGFEEDEYDPHSMHVLITHRRSGVPAGCVRIVKATESKPLLPFECKFPRSLDPQFFSRLEADRNTVCEISRLAVDPLFRRRNGESGSRLGDIHALDISRLEYRTFSLIAESAFVAATALTEISGRTNVFALMEPYLCRLLVRSGIYFLRVGRDVNLHGLRAPYYITPDSVRKNLNPELMEFYQGLSDDLTEAYHFYTGENPLSLGGHAV